MYLIALWQGAPKSSLTEWRNALIVGACLLFFGNGSVTVAEQWVPSGLASLLVATVPIYIAILAWLTGSAPRPRPLVMLGLAGGFAGVGILVGPAITAPPAGGSHHAGLGMVILLFGSLLWSIGSLYSRRARNSSFALSLFRPDHALRRRAHDHRRTRPRRSARFSPQPGDRGVVRRVRLSRPDRRGRRLYRLHLAPAPLRSGQGRDLRLRQPGRGRLARRFFCR